MTHEEFDLQSRKTIFKPGQIVELKSGGPKMTVEMWRTDGLVCTQWFDGALHMRDSFDPVCLVLS